MSKLTKQQLNDKLAQLKVIAQALEQGLDDAIEATDGGVINELYLEICTIVESVNTADKYNKRVQSTYRDDLSKGKKKN